MESFQRVDFTHQSAAEYAGIGLVGTYLLAAQCVWQKLMPLRMEIGTLVDFGCGAGKSTRAASRCVRPRGTAVGVDISAEMVAQATKVTAESKAALPEVEFVYKQIQCEHGREVIPLPDGAADAATTTMVLQEMQTEEQLQNAVSEIGRISKKGGWFAAVCDNDAIACEEYTAFTYAPFPENRTRSDNYVKSRSTVSNIVWEKDRFWSREILARCIERAGFRIRSIDYPLADPKTPPFPDDPAIPWKDELTFSPLMVFWSRKLG
ncbi:MAG: methyltransferase domain-containing protein [Anaerolineales bacterium]|nr:methyltransferase domain-containing protein [Anaerolineales bacterium]